MLNVHYNWKWNVKCLLEINRYSSWYKNICKRVGDLEDMTMVIYRGDI